MFFFQIKNQFLIIKSPISPIWSCQDPRRVCVCVCSQLRRSCCSFVFSLEHVHRSRGIVLLPSFRILIRTLHTFHFAITTKCPTNSDGRLASKYTVRSCLPFVRFTDQQSCDKTIRFVGCRPTRNHQHARYIGPHKEKLKVFSQT